MDSASALKFISKDKSKLKTPGLHTVSFKLCKINELNQKQYHDYKIFKYLNFLVATCRWYLMRLL